MWPRRVSARYIVAPSSLHAMPFGVSEIVEHLAAPQVAIEHVETAVGGAGLRVHRAAPVASRRVAFAVVEAVVPEGRARDRRSASTRRCRSRRTRSPSAAQPAGDHRRPARSSRCPRASASSLPAPVDNVMRVDRRRLAHVDPEQPVTRFVVQRILADMASRAADRAHACAGSAASYHARSCRPSWRALVARLCTCTHSPGRDRRRRAADELAVLAYAQAGGQRSHGEFVSRADVLLQRDLAHHAIRWSRARSSPCPGATRRWRRRRPGAAVAPAAASARSVACVIRLAGTGALRSDQSFVLHLIPERAGIAARQWARFCAASCGLPMPVTTLATAGWASGNCSAAAARATPCRAHTASMRATRAAMSGSAWLVEVGGAGSRAGGENARVERRRHQHADAASRAFRQERVERRVVEQRVAAREHEAVEVAVRGEALEDAPVVDADTDRLDRAGRRAARAARDTRRASPRHSAARAGRPASAG